MATTDPLEGKTFIVYYLPNNPTSKQLIDLLQPLRNQVVLQNALAVSPSTRPPWLSGAPILVDIATRQVFKGTAAFQKASDVLLLQRVPPPTTFPAGPSGRGRGGGVAAGGGNNNDGGGGPQPVSRGSSRAYDLGTDGAGAGAGGDDNDPRFSGSGKLDSISVEEYMRRRSQQQQRMNAGGAGGGGAGANARPNFLEQERS
jgi:hypothetical protein